MVGLQWCSACDAPRFKWQVQDVEDVPDVCLSCGQGAVQARFAAERLTELRRALGEWARGEGRSGADQSWLNRRRAHVRQRFDQVIGWWDRQPTRPPELQRLLREYHNRGRPRLEPPVDPAGEPDAGLPVDARRLDAERLHELTQHLKSLADEPHDAPEAAIPKEPMRPRRSWGILRRSPPQADGDSTS